jgi:2-phosphoglycerate kinase
LIFPKIIIKNFIDFNQDYVIEGLYLLPSLINQFKKEKKYWSKIKPIYIIKKDVEKIAEGLSKDKEGDNWLLSKIGNDKERLRSAAKMVQTKALYFEKEGKKYNFKVVNTEDDFNKIIIVLN